MEITVNKKERLPVTLTLSKPRGAEYIDDVSVTIREGSLKIEMGFSKYSTEDKWYCDDQFTNGLPVFSHGMGSRSCLKTYAQGDLLKAIESAEFTLIEV